MFVLTPKGGAREGAGRPRQLKGTKRVTMGVVLDGSLKADITKAAGEFGITEGELIRRAIRFGLIDKQQLVTIQTKGGKKHG